MKADSLVGYNKKKNAGNSSFCTQFFHWRAARMVRGWRKQDLRKEDLFSLEEKKAPGGLTAELQYYREPIEKTEPGYSWWCTVEGWETSTLP